MDEWRRAQGKHLAVRPREISIYRPFRPPDRKYAHHGYHGLQIASNRLVFVLDKSESMFYGLFDGVVEEMEAHLSSVGPTSRFNVIEFDEKPRAWGKKLVPANDANLRGAVEYLNRAKPYGPTNIIDSLRLGMLTPDLDSLVLLSDGLPNRGTPNEPGAILAAIRKENRYTRYAIHTVLLMEGRAFKHDQPKENLPPSTTRRRSAGAWIRETAHQTPLGAFLKQLADENDGSFGIGFADAWLPAARREVPAGDRQVKRLLLLVLLACVAQGAKTSPLLRLADGRVLYGRDVKRSRSAPCYAPTSACWSSRATSSPRAPPPPPRRPQGTGHEDALAGDHPRPLRGTREALRRPARHLFRLDVKVYQLDLERTRRGAPYKMRVFRKRRDFKELQKRVAPGIEQKGQAFAEGVAGSSRRDSAASSSGTRRVPTAACTSRSPSTRRRTSSTRCWRSRSAFACRPGSRRAPPPTSRCSSPWARRAAMSRRITPAPTRRCWARSKATTRSRAAACGA